MKNRIGFFILTLICAAVVSVLAVKYLVKLQTVAPIAQEESVYDRVIKSGKIRCAYAEYPPFFMKDANTGKMSGGSYEIAEMIGQKLGLQIEWTEEVPWGSIIEGLNSDRYDAFCTGLWANASRGKIIDFSIPFAYSALNAYTRDDETRFNQDITSINNADVKIATLDGEMGDLIAHSQFPLAQRVSLPQGTDFSQLFLQVTTGKADIVFAEPSQAIQFEKTNPDKLQNLSTDRPVRVLPVTIPFKRGQEEFKAMIDHALEEMINNGDVSRIIKASEPAPGSFFLDAYPYRPEQ